MSEELKPCPFCGGEVAITQAYGLSIHCGSCECTTYFIGSHGFAQWNKRACFAKEILAGTTPPPKPITWEEKYEALAILSPLSLLMHGPGAWLVSQPNVAVCFKYGTVPRITPIRPTPEESVTAYWELLTTLPQEEVVYVGRSTMRTAYRWSDVDRKWHCA